MFSSSSSLLNTVLDKFQSLIQSRYSSAVVATSLVIGIPLLRDFYRSETNPSMEKTILEVYDALLTDLLGEHCKNVNRNKKKRMKNEAVIKDKNNKRQDENDDDYSEENTISELDEEVCYCVAVPLELEMDCLAKLIEVVDQKEQEQEQSTQRILSGIKAVVVNGHQQEEIYFDVAATIHFRTNGKNRNRHDYLLLSPEFIETIDENALTDVVSLAIGYFLSSEDASVNVHHRSVIRDLISIFILVTHFQANSFLAGVIDEKYVQQFDEDENDDEGKSSPSSFNGMTDRATIAKEVITDIFENPSSFGHTQMIGFLSSIRHFLEETSSLQLFSSKDDHDKANCYLVLPNLIDNNQDLKIDFNFLSDPETEALCTTQFHQTLIARTTQLSSSSLAFPCSNNSNSSCSIIKQFIKSIKRDLKFTFTRSLHDFIPLFGKYGQVRKALRWIPFAAVAFQLGSTFFFTAVSKMEQFGDDLTSSNHDNHHENENNNNEDDDLFSQICSLALSSTWLQQTVMTFGHGWVQYSTDSTMASRWFLLAMTSDYETFTDGNNNRTKTPLMSSPSSSPKQQQQVRRPHHHHHQPIDGALASVAKTLESVPGLLTSLDSALYLPTNNLVGLMMMIAAGIPSELLLSTTTEINKTQLHHHNNNSRVLTSLFKTTLLFSIFVTLKRVYGFVYDQRCMDTTTLHFSMTIRKRIQAREEARMANMMNRLQEEESSRSSSSSLMMISVDPYVNTASIFCNARGSSNYHGNDGYEECLDYSRKSSRLMTNGNRKKQTMKNKEGGPSLEEFMALMGDDDRDDEFTEDDQEAENNEEDGLNDKESPAFFAPTTSIDYTDDDDEDCFWWSLPEPISNLYSDYCEVRRRRRTPTLGLALLSTACSSPVESSIPALDFIIGKTSEQSRPPSHLMIRWPSTPLHINKFFDNIIADYHKEYLHPLHVSMREVLEEIIINKAPPECKTNNTEDEKKKIISVPSSNSFFCKSSIVCGGNHNHKPSFETLQSLFETDRFRALRAAGYEVEAAMPSATKFVVQLESHIDHPFSCSSFGGGSGGGGGILSSQKLGHDLCEALEEGVLEFLTNYFADNNNNDDEKSLSSSSSSHPLKLSAQDVDRLKAMNVSSDSLSLSKGGSVVSSWFEQGFAAGTSELFDLKKKQMENIAAVEVDHTLAKLSLFSPSSSSPKKETKHQKSEIDQDFEMLERMKECSDRNKNDEREISELLKSELHRSRNIDCCFPSSSSSQSVPTPLHTSFEKNILFVSSSSLNWTWTFQNVSFAYPSNPDKLVLKDISFSISSKITKSVGICAESGTGKSTLFLLMLKIYLPTQGRILLNDVDLREVPPRWLRRHIAYVGPACKLFKGATARGQVLTANPLIREDAPLLLSSSSSSSQNNTTHQATQALREAQVPERMYLRSSFNSASSSSIPPFPTAASMSGGEQQRVQIARAFGKMIMARQENANNNNNDTNSNLYIRNNNDNRVIALLFDEGTSALDAKTEEEIVRAIEGECGSESENEVFIRRENHQGSVLTIPRFVISHRLFTIRDCDHILILHKHRLVSQGSFPECVDRARRMMSETITTTTTSRMSPVEKQQLAGEMWFNEVVQRQMLKGEEKQKEEDEEEAEEEDEFLEEAEED